MFDPPNLEVNRPYLIKLFLSPFDYIENGDKKINFTDQTCRHTKPNKWICGDQLHLDEGKTERHNTFG